MNRYFAVCLLIAFMSLASPVMAQEATAPAAVPAAVEQATTPPPATTPAPAAGPEAAAPVIKMVELPEAAITPPPKKEKNKIFMFFDNFFSKFSGKVEAPDPSDRMIAPFEPDTALLSPAERILNPLPVNAASLERAHRSSADLAAWLQMAIPETLSFNSDSYQEHLTVLGRGFSPAALSEYNTWVTATGILDALKGNALQLNGFVTDTPFLLNEGVVAGRYRWLFEVPVMVSFVPRDTKDYRGKVDVETRRLIITLQLGRVLVSSLPDNVMIETWSVRDNLRKN